MSRQKPYNNLPRLTEYNWDGIEDINTLKGYDLNSGLIGHWKCNDSRADTDVKDTAGGNTGTAQQNTEDISVDGKIRKALSFNGSSDYVSVASSSRLNFGLNDFCISFWAKIDTASVWQEPITKADNQYSTHTQRVGILYFTPTGHDRLASSSALGNYFDGKLDDIRIYDKALTDREIKAIYNNGNGTEEEQSGYTSLVGAWLNKRTRNSASDYSREGNDGTLISVPETQLVGYRFDGNDDSILISDTVYQSLTYVTVSMWVRTSDKTNNNWLFNCYQNANDAWGIRMYDTVGGLGIYDDIDNAGSNLYNQSIENDRWYYVVAMIDSLENKLYINGELVGSGTDASDYWNSFTGSIYIGSRAGGATENHEGDIKDVRIYSEAKSPSWVKNEYKKGVGE